MEELKFKTNIKCSGCVAKVTPFLDEAAGQGQWEVDVNNPAKILKIINGLDEKKVREAVEKAGYKAELI